MKRSKGFTLVELMIAVAILAIIAAVAYPSFLGQLAKSRRGEAQAFMMDVSQREQARFLDTRNYIAIAANSEFDDADKLNMPVPDAVSKNYNVTVTLTCTPAPPPPCFRVTATPIVGKPQDKDGVLILESNGNKSRKGSPDLW